MEINSRYGRLRCSASFPVSISRRSLSHSLMHNMVDVRKETSPAFWDPVVTCMPASD